MTSFPFLVDIQRQRSWIPSEFIDFLKARRSSTANAISIDGNDSWSIYKPDIEIGEQVSLNHIAVPRWRLGEAFVEMYRGMGMEFTNGQTCSLNEISSGVFFASSNDEFLVFTEHSGVILFSPEGCNVKQLATTWELFESGFIASESDQGQIVTDSCAVVGRWKPISSKSMSPRLFSLVCPVLCFETSGTLRETFANGKSVESEWRIANDRLAMLKPEGRVEYDYSVISDQLEIEQHGGGFHCLYKRISAD